MKFFPSTILALAITLLAASITSAQNNDEPTWTVESLEIQGNEAFEDDELRDLMVTRPLGFLRSAKFRPDVFRNDLENLREFYRQQGYLNAQIVDTQIIRDTSEYNVHLAFTIDEGPVTTVDGIEVFGNQAFADSTLLNLIPLEPGEPFQRRVLQQGMLDIAAFYADSGYLEASVTPETKVNEQVHRVVIDLNVSEGRRMRISDVQIEGLEKTNRSVVERELEFNEGQIISYSELLKSQRNLYGTGLFKSVYIEPVKQPDDTIGQRTIVVSLTERLNSLLTVSAGYGSVEKIMGEIELSIKNLAGTARQVGGRIQANFIERRAELSFTEPRTFDTRIKTDLNLFFSYEDQPSFDVSRFGGLFTIGREVWENGHAMLRFRYENQQLRNVEIDELPEDLDPRIRSVTVAYSRDTRNNLFNPTRGAYLEVSYELAGAFLQGSDAFNRIITQGNWYTPVWQSAVFATAAEIGWMDIFGASGGIPLNERLYAGGPNSIRGFNYQEVGPRDERRQFIGGQLKFVWNLEIRQAIWRWIGFATFLDLGNVWEKPPEFKFNRIRAAVGAGPRVNSPIGIIRLDLGVPVDPDPDEDEYQIFVSMGHAF